MTIEIIHHFIGNRNRGGMAVMAQHTHGYSWVEVAIVPCSAADQYLKKVAVQLLRDSFQNVQTIKLPISTTLRNRVNHRTLRDVVIVAFHQHATIHCSN